MTMRRLMLALVGLMVSVNVAFAAVTISTSSKTFQKAGGGASVTVNGTGEWTAVADVDWIVIRQGATGNGPGACVYIVNANTTADTRIGHIHIDENEYTITQYGYTATIEPTNVLFDRKGGTGTINVSVEAGISWTAHADVDWLTVTSEPSGTSVGSVSYSVSEYFGVVTRIGTLTVGGQAFTVSQTGADVALEPELVKKAADSDIVSVTVRALATTAWEVVPNDPWISVIDKEAGYGDYVLMLAVNSNPSFERRTGTVSIGSAILTITQEGTSSASLSINPENARAAASGAYGNVVVLATPDAPWKAESQTSWLTISEGATGAGNGNIKYVVSANPTLEERVGSIKITPPYRLPDPDLFAGMVCRITEKSDFGQHSLSSALSKPFDGSFLSTLSGPAFPPKDADDFSIAFSFKVTELNRINRLATVGGMGISLVEDNSVSIGGARSEWQAEEADKYYTLVFRYDDQSDIGDVFVGEAGDELELVLSLQMGDMTLLDFSSVVAASQFKLGYSTEPTSGNLTGGMIQDFRIWTRALSDMECAQADVKKDVMAEAEPKVTPNDIVWDYFQLDGHAYRTKSGEDAPFSKNTTETGWFESANRFGFRQRAMTSDGEGKIVIANFGELFSGSCITNNGKTLSRSNYKSRSNDNYYPYPIATKSGSEVNAAYSFWMNVSTLPESGNATLLERRLSYTKDAQSVAVSPQKENEVFLLSLTPKGKLVVTGSGVVTTAFDAAITIREWHLITIVGVSGMSVQVYVDGREIGNVSSSMTLGYLPPTIDQRYYHYHYYSSSSVSEEMYGSIVSNPTTFTLGGWTGAVDDLMIFHDALTSAEVRELYEKGRATALYHKVTQGVQTAQLNETVQYAPAEGCTSSVALTLAQSVRWEAVPNCDWITVTSDEEGAGSSVVSFTVAANPMVTERVGTLTVAGIELTVVQEGLLAEVDCEATNFGVGSDSGTIIVTTEGGGMWTAEADVDWIHVLDESGVGTGFSMFVVDDYNNTTQSRCGTITIAGQKVIITQQGYELSIDPAIAEIGSNAGAGQFGVAAPIDAVWEAIADCDWITIIGARTGIGDGTIQYTVTDNLTGETRTGRIIVGGKEYMITQKTTLPLNTQVVGSGSITGAGNYNQGSKVALRAIPASGHVFSHWSGDAVGNDETVEITVDIEKNVTATFIPEAAAQRLAEQKAAQGGFYTRDQIHALEMGNLVFDVDASGTARVGVKLLETSDLSDPNSWKPATLNGNPDVGQDGTVGMKVKAEGNAKFFKVVMPE